MPELSVNTKLESILAPSVELTPTFFKSSPGFSSANPALRNGSPKDKTKMSETAHINLNIAEQLTLSKKSETDALKSYIIGLI